MGLTAPEVTGKLATGRRLDCMNCKGRASSASELGISSIPGSPSISGGFAMVVMESVPRIVVRFAWDGR